MALSSHKWKLALLFLFTVALSSSLRPRRAEPGKLFAEFNRRQKEIFQIVAAGKYSEAIPLYRAAADQAKAAGHQEFSRKFLNNLGACQIAVFHYGSALKSLVEARSLAENAHNKSDRSILDLNISSLYLQMGNLSEAAAAAEEGLSLARAGTPQNRAKLLIVLANVRAKMGQLDLSQAIFTEGINAALQADDSDTAAWGWDYLGFEYRKAGRLNEAERASTEAFRMRKVLHLAAIDSSYWNLGMLRAERGDLPSARVLLDQAVLALAKSGGATPAWSIYAARGRVKLRQGDLPAALADLRVALDIARIWRVDVVPNDVNRTNSESGLAELYSLFIEAGNRLYLKNRDPRLALETFEAAEENRAASLRALVPQPHDWRNRLPTRYWETLARLQAAERADLQEGRPAQPATAHLRSVLAEMEAAAGSPAAVSRSSALERTQQNLDQRSALFSFYLDDSASWVWSVTRAGFTLNALPPRQQLAASIRAFEQQVHENSPAMKDSGEALYCALFGSLQPVFASRDRWLLALDRDLFDLPFAALSVEPGVFLVEKHELQITSGALMLQPGAEGTDLNGPFLALGDPVYNHADSRFGQAPSRPMRRGSSPTFARLWGSGREVHSAAETWRAKRSILLTGPDASRSRFWAATEEAAPSVIHLATHILEEKDSANTGWIALSLGADGQPEYITPAEIAARSVSARLVVLSGCSSGKAEVRSASGLMGLTRAWLAAGAGAVLATRWPTVDDDGEFFQSFYGYLRKNPTAGPAGALRLASIDMRNSGTWRAQSGFWAGFFLVGNH